MGEDEFEARMKHRVRKILHQNSNVSPTVFLVAWVWEHAIRNRLCPRKVGKLCCLTSEFIAHLGEVASKTLHDVLGSHFGTFIVNRRLAGYAPNTVNNDVIYLQSLGREIERLTGVDVAGGLEQEAADTAERLPFTFAEVVRIFEALKIMDELAAEWTTFLLVMLYTAMRPDDAARVKRSDIDLERGTIKIKSSKTAGFNRKREPKPMHEALHLYLRGMIADKKLALDDYLCLNLAHKVEKHLAQEFSRILKAADVDALKATGENRRHGFSQKTLYSFRHTSNVWFGAAGGSEEEQKAELGDSTDQALRHYQHDTDPEVIAARRKKINLMPRVPVAWNGTNGGSVVPEILSAK
jgi:integrase